MGKFSGPTPKRHKLFSNDEHLLSRIAARAGFMSREEQAACTVKTATKYVDRAGVKRHVGNKRALKESQNLTGVNFQTFVFVFTSKLSLVFQNVLARVTK